MAKRGRKPDPPALKLLRGGPAPAGTAPAPNPARPPCPEYLDEDARDEWSRVVVELESLGALTAECRPLLMLYCNAFSRWMRARGETLDVVSSTDLGSPKANPAVAVEKDAESTMLRILSEMGLTPASRNRVGGRSEGPKDRLGEFLARRKKTS